MSERDNIQGFIFEEDDVRGHIAHMDQAYQDIIGQHQYPPYVQKTLGEFLTATVLLAATIKFEGQITLQFRAEGALSMLVAKCSHNNTLRGLAKFDSSADEDALKSALVGDLVITIEYDKKVKPYQSIVPIHSHSIAESLEFYFAQSEQLSTKIWLSADDKQAGGMLLQLLPGENGERREHFWEYATKMGETITSDELFSLENEQLLYRLYHESKVRVFERNPLQFCCSCSEEKMKRAILTLGKVEVENLLKVNESIDIRCDYCNKLYSFDRVDAAELFHGS